MYVGPSLLSGSKFRLDASDWIEWEGKEDEEDAIALRPRPINLLLRCDTSGECERGEAESRFEGEMYYSVYLSSENTPGTRF